MKYSYTARTGEGKLTSGQMEAASESELASLLHNDGKVLTRAEANAPVQAKRSGLHDWLRRLRSVSVVDKIFFTQNLQVMIRAGLSVATSLSTLAQQTGRGSFAKIIREIANKVERGIPMSDAMADHPKVFADVYINMVRAGEKSGKLDEVLAQLTTQLRKNHALVSKVRGALTYPIIIVCAMISIGIAMMIFVIPKITGLFTEVNATLPLPTRILIAVSDFTMAHGLWLGLGFIVLVVLFVRVIHTRRGRALWHRLLLRLPILAPIIKKINLAKFCRTFSSLLKTDIPIVQAFQITATTLGNQSYRTVVESAAELVKKGVAIASIVRGHPKLFSPLVVQMIAVGEETGSLDTILEELSSFYEDDVDRTMSNLSTIIEPVLMLILGAGVGLLAVSIIMPIYSLTEAI